MSTTRRQTHLLHSHDNRNSKQLFNLLRFTGSTCFFNRGRPAVCHFTVELKIQSKHNTLLDINVGDQFRSPADHFQVLKTIQ